MNAKLPGRTSVIRGWRGHTRQRNKELEEPLFREIYEALVKLAREADFTKSIEPAELVNELYLKWQGGAALQDWQNRMQFYTFARRALRNMLIDGYRKGKNLKVEVLMDYCGGELLDMNHVDVNQIITDIGNETPAYGQVLTLKAYSFHTDEEIADALGVSESAAKRYFNKAKAEFRKRLENNPPLI